jgi:SAM-dependent methyltransferase
MDSIERTITDEANVAWSNVATAWERNATWVERAKAPLTERLLEWLDIGAGARVLELGAGPGLLGRQLAEIAGPDGLTIVSDVAAAMVDAARRTLAGARGVEVRQLDACATGLPGGSQDAVVFRMGLMFVPAPEQAVAEIRRVLAPRGRVAVAVWAAPEHNPWLTSVGMAAMMHGLVSGGPPVGPGGLFSLAQPAELERVFAAGGFADATIDTVDLTMPFDSFDTYFTHVTSMAGPLAAAFSTADPEQLDAVRETARSLTAAFVTDAGLELPARANLVLAQR